MGRAVLGQKKATGQKKNGKGIKYANGRRDKINKCIRDKKTQTGQKNSIRDKIKSDTRDKKTWTRGPKGGAPNPEKVGLPKGGALEGWEARNFALFSPSPASPFSFFFSLWVSSRGILVVFGAPGQSNVHVWSSGAVV